MAKSVVVGSVNVVTKRTDADCVVIRAAVVMQERVGSIGRVPKAGGVGRERREPECGVVIIREREITNGSVLKAVNICKKRGIAKSVVAEPADVVKERKGADSVIIRAVVVEEKRIGSNGHVLCAAGIEQHRCSANCGILIRPGSGEGQRSSANTGVEAGVTD